ncbi:arginine kinase [Ahrensia sp. R2A130]|uniref:arginine kinase n=1 Tax=Ahrensia sp. R2A130 TaxID=744979 RepID=UPI0001E0F89F|nr:arginine kinase [Ahrensia sp. R2A130]EFL89036.1 arginine kinase [Ahrensia sp. R2A130]
MTDADFISAVKALGATQMIAAQAFDASEYAAYDSADKMRVQRCIASGLNNSDSAMGCYLGEMDDVSRLRPWFSRIAELKHGIAQAEPYDPEPANGRFDIADFGLPPVSARIRVGRNLDGYPLPALMTEADRLALEEEVVSAVTKLGWEGEYHSLTQARPDTIDAAQQQKLIDEHLLFKPLDTDPYLRAAGVSGNWPSGRGCWISAQRDTIIWVNEEDHLRIMMIRHSTALGALLDDLMTRVAMLEGALGRSFLHDNQFGYLTSCPTNFGTAMRASLHIALPHLMATPDQLKAAANDLGLDLRGVRGEHSDAGEDGTVDLSPAARLGVTEQTIVERLYRGAGTLWTAERAISR